MSESSETTESILEFATNGIATYIEQHGTAAAKEIIEGLDGAGDGIEALAAVASAHPVAAVVGLAAAALAVEVAAPALAIAGTGLGDLLGADAVGAAVEAVGTIIIQNGVTNFVNQLSQISPDLGALVQGEIDEDASIGTTSEFSTVDVPANPDEWGITTAGSSQYTEDISVVSTDPPVSYFAPSGNSVQITELAGGGQEVDNLDASHTVETDALYIDAAADPAERVDFLATKAVDGGTVYIENSLDYTGTIDGFAQSFADQFNGNNIILENFGTGSFFATMDAPDDEIDIYSTTGTTPVAILHLASDEDYSGRIVDIGSDDKGTVGLSLVPETACFLAGTRILTGNGEVPVERLGVGDAVVVVAPEGRRLAAVTWIGWRRLDASRHRSPTSVWPIRIRRSAFGADQPSRDLLVSPDHAIFVDGVLIPARYLVNSASIVQDRTIDDIAYFHVELAAHAILLADGLAVESYLDSGNRAAFANGGDSPMLHADFGLRLWQAKGCAKLVCGGAELVAARSFLLEQAAALGHVATREPALRLLAGGRTIPPEQSGPRHSFHIVPGAGDARLLSRAASPADMLADGDDHRQLGVAVARIVLDGTPIPLTDTRLRSGWHDVEYLGGRPAWRWTDGDASLALAGARMLDIEVAMSAHYWRHRARLGQRAA
jgi:hypothetical protein